MTVKELVEQLSAMPQGATVIVWDADNAGYMPATGAHEVKEGGPVLSDYYGVAVDYG
jgi:hypothetical protein